MMISLGSLADWKGFGINPEIFHHVLLTYLDGLGVVGLGTSVGDGLGTSPLTFLGPGFGGGGGG